MNSSLQRAFAIAAVVVSGVLLGACGKTVIDEKKAADSVKSTLENSDGRITFNKSDLHQAG